MQKGRRECANSAISYVHKMTKTSRSTADTTDTDTDTIEATDTDTDTAKAADTDTR